MADQPGLSPAGLPQGASVVVGAAVVSVVSPVPGAAVVVVGGSVGTVTCSGLSPLIDGVAGVLSLQAVSPMLATARRANRAPSTRRRGREEVRTGESTPVELPLPVGLTPD